MGMIDDTDCMLWARAVTRKGYADVSVKRANGEWGTARLHRELYMVEKGDIPDGLVLDHLCGNRRCVNTDHLEPVTNTENLNRGNRPKVWGTHCNNGHPVLPGSYWKYGTKRMCKTCKRNYVRAQRHKSKQ